MQNCCELCLYLSLNLHEFVYLFTSIIIIDSYKWNLIFLQIEISILHKLPYINLILHKLLDHFLWIGSYHPYWLEAFHCVKGVRIRSYSTPYFPALGLNSERYDNFVSMSSIKMRTDPKKLNRSVLIEFGEQNQVGKSWWTLFHRTFLGKSREKRTILAIFWQVLPPNFKK